ncbi:MAG: Hsp70 family protein [Alphaproteobacteria bacterium]
MLIQIQEPGQSTEVEKKGKVLGIDFGTTHSVVAYSEKSQAHIVPIETERLVPSVVHYESDQVWVGHKAESFSASIRSIKRYMSPEFPNPYDHNPIDVACDIFTYIKHKAENVLREPVTGAVITVPAYYGEAAREATRKAAHMAGIPVLRLLSEPTAAALAYRLDEQKEGIYLVYDLGGGTFDVSVLQMKKGIFQVLAVQGKLALGGDDFDEAIWEHFLKPKYTGSKIEGVLQARTIKEHLSFAARWEGKIGGQTLFITQEMISAILQPWVSKTILLCEEALKDAGVNKNQLQGVVLVGGSSRIPCVQNEVENFFNQKPLGYLNPDEVVALGAALHAEALVTGKGKLLLDVTPFALGMETLGGAVEVLIPRNASLPCAISQQFTTSYDGQTKIKIHVVQGEGPRVENAISLATFVLSDIPPMHAGLPQIKVTFTLDADGILSVTAEEQISHQKQSIQVKPSYSF